MAPGIALSIWSLFVDMSIDKLQKQNQPGAADSPSGQTDRGFWVYFSVPLVLLYLVNMLQSFSFHGVVTFLPTYMSQYTSFQILSWDSVAIGGMLSGIALFMGVFGQYAGGVLSEKKNLKRNIAVMGIMSFPFILSMAFAKDVILLRIAGPEHGFVERGRNPVRLAFGLQAVHARRAGGENLPFWQAFWREKQAQNRCFWPFWRPGRRTSTLSARSRSTRRRHSLHASGGPPDRSLRPAR
jgi:hypothetical protein